MNKKGILTIIAIVLIVVLAVFVGKKLSKNNVKNTNSDIINNTPIPTEKIETPNTETTEEPNVTEKPLSTTVPEEIKDITKMTNKEKEEYAKSIAKESWEKLGINKTVYLDLENIDNNGIYLIAVRDAETTNAMKWCEIDIKTRKCEMFD